MLPDVIQGGSHKLHLVFPNRFLDIITFILFNFKHLQRTFCVVLLSPATPVDRSGMSLLDLANMSQ